VYEYVDEDTGQTSSLKLSKIYIKAVGDYILIGKTNAVTTKEVLERIHKPDTTSAMWA